MNKLIAIMLLVASTSALAQHDRHEIREYRNERRNEWVAPLIIGGVVGAMLSQPRDTYSQPPVIYQEPQIIYEQPIYNSRPMYRAIDVYIRECNCYRTINVQIK